MLKYAIIMEEFPGYTVSELEAEDPVTVEGLYTIICARRMLQAEEARREALKAGKR